MPPEQFVSPDKPTSVAFRPAHDALMVVWGGGAAARGLASRRYPLANRDYGRPHGAADTRIIAFTDSGGSREVASS